MKTPNIIEYHYRGQVERGTGSGYRWVDGYSETVNGSVLFPWMTPTECAQDAKSKNAHGKLIRSPIPPQTALPLRVAAWRSETVKNLQ